MKKLEVVIITMHIYPKQSPRSYRATELALELARIGHSVTLYAMLGEYDYEEFSKTNNINVKSIGHTLTGLDHSDGTLRYNIIDKVLRLTLHKIMEYPLIELAFKIPGLLKNETKIDLLITIAAPHTIHWGAAIAKKINTNFPTKWVSDCGDPYMGNPIERNKFFYFKYMEKFWCKSTDYIVVPLANAKLGYYPEFHSKIRVIPQGYDFDITKITDESVYNPVPTFSYAGNVYPEYRDPSSFLNYISTLKINFKFIVYTNNITYFSEYSKLLGDKIKIISAIERKKLIFELSKVDFLINIRNNSNIQSPSKLIDYTLAGRPIITISTIFSIDEKEKFNEFLNGNFARKDNKLNISDFNIANVTNKFIELYYEN